jgi:hypothetical protein
VSVTLLRRGVPLLAASTSAGVVAPTLMCSARCAAPLRPAHLPHLRVCVRACVRVCVSSAAPVPRGPADKPPVRYTADSPTRYCDMLESVVPTDPNTPYDMKQVMQCVADEGTLFEVMPDAARNLVVGFARLNGQTVGMVGNEPMELAGCLDINSSVKVRGGGPGVGDGVGGGWGGVLAKMCLRGGVGWLPFPSARPRTCSSDRVGVSPIFCPVGRCVCIAACPCGVLRSAMSAQRYLVCAKC